MARKGISLPINMVVILAVAVLVLVVVAAFFVIQSGGSQRTITDQAAWGTGCSLAIAQGCPLSVFENLPTGGLFIANYDPNGDDEKVNGVSKCNSNTFDDADNIKCYDNTLRKACERTQNGNSRDACRAKCCGGTE